MHHDNLDHSPNHHRHYGFHYNKESDDAVHASSDHRPVNFLNLKVQYLLVYLA